MKQADMMGRLMAAVNNNVHYGNCRVFLAPAAADHGIYVGAVWLQSRSEQVK